METELHATIELIEDFLPNCFILRYTKALGVLFDLSSKGHLCGKRILLNVRLL